MGKKKATIVVFITILFIFSAANKLPAQSEEKKTNITKPNYVFIYTGQIPGVGVWFGPMKYKFGADLKVSLDTIPYDPTKHKIIIITKKADLLPEYLGLNKAYYWTGETNYEFIKDIHTDEEIEAIVRLLGEKGKVPNEYGEAPWYQ